jgi:uncharacterized protein YqjF (DUF2071 family)
VKVIGYQRWDSLLFLHWQVPAESLRPLVPERLSIDTFEGRAYVTLAPFTVMNARLILTPNIPGLSRFHELNVRTYVRWREDRGIWFFSLDAASALAAFLARVSVRLPYFFARMRRDRNGPEFHYRSERYGFGSSRKAIFRASWQASNEAYHAAPESLDYFLTERYMLFSRAFGSRLWRVPVRHPPWPLQHVDDLNIAEQTIDTADGLPKLGGDVIARYTPGVDVEFVRFGLV